jgi:hypothetical protein
MAPSRTVTGPAGDPLAEAVELTRRLKLPYIRKGGTTGCRACCSDVT